LAVKPELILITQLERDYIQNKVKEMKFSKEINPSIIISSIIRAALDCRAYGLIKKDLIDKVLTEIKAKEESCKCVGFYCVAKYAVMAATKEFIAQGICKNKTATVEYVLNRYTSFLREGSQAWYEQLPADNLSSKKTTNDNANVLHARFKGVIEIDPKLDVKDPCELDKLFSEDQIRVISEAIRKNPDIAWEITCKRNYTCIVTDGTAVLGFGDITPLGGLPVMEGKSALFKELGGTDMATFCIDVHEPQAMIDVIRKILPIFSAINLEDIKAPECFEVERALIALYDKPVFHDD